MEDAANQSAGSPEDGALSQADTHTPLNDDVDTTGPGASAGESADGASTADSAVSQADIDVLMQSAGDTKEGKQGPTPAASEADDQRGGMGRPIDAAAARGPSVNDSKETATAKGTAAEVATGQGSPLPDGAAPVELHDLGVTSLSDEQAKRVTMLNDVNLRVKLQLGQTTMLVEDVLHLGEGSVVELNKLAGDPVDVLVNDRLIARGEVLVLNDVFCVRISEVLSSDPHRIVE